MTTMNGNIVPIEVKAGATSSLKSLHIFMDEKNIHLVIRLPTLPFQLEQNILSLPIYLISELARLVKERQP